jgi:ribose transport system ATP-binding protein
MVVREGKIAGELGADELSEEAIILLASGVQQTSTQQEEAKNVA